MIHKLGLAAGIGTLLLGGVARLSVGRVQGEAKAVELISSLADSGLYLGSAVATASATMLALMLTILGLTKQADTEFDTPVYKRVYRVAVFATWSLLGSIALLLTLTLPINEFEGVPDNYFAILYNVIFGLTVIVCALLACTVVLLFETVKTIIAKITPLDSV